MKEVRPDGNLGIAFNNKMLLPDDFMEKVKSSRLRSLKGDGPALIEILSIAGSESPADLVGLDWEITKFTELALDFKLFYTNPLEISQNDEPDMA